MISHLINNQKGFTLIELLAAVTILAIIITPMFGLFSETFKNNRAAKEKTEAAALAQYEIEELKTMHFDELSSMIGNTKEELPIKGKPMFNRITEIFSEDSELIHIKVTVYWDGGEVSFSTLKGDTGL